MEAFLARWGYLALFGGTVLEGEAVLIAAGAMAHRGLLSLPLVMAVAFAGGVLGDQAWFFVGRHYGTRYLERRAELRARAGVVQGWLDKYGTLFLLGFRFMYGLRSVTPALLGATHFPALRFLRFNVAGALLWSVSFAMIGYGMGASLSALLDRYGRAHELLLAGIALAAIVAAVVYWRVRRRERAPAAT